MLKLFLFCLVILGVTAQDESKGDIEAITRFVAAFQTLTGDILYNFAKENPGKPYITSIPPLMRALAEPGELAKGSTSKEILKLFNAKNKTEITKYFTPSYKQFLSDDKDSNTTEYFGKVYGDEDKTFTKNFKKIVKSFNDKSGTADFEDPQMAADEINKEVEEQGKGGFNPLVTSKDVQKGGLLFVSAYEIYVKFLQRMIPKPETIKYKKGNKTLKIPAFTLEDSIPYAKNDDIDAQVFEFRLQGNQFSVIVFYPNKPDGLEEMLEKIRSSNVFNDAIDQLQETCVQATLPIVNIRFKVDLAKSLLKVRNVTANLFDSKKPKFEGVQNSTTYIGSILHETSINTNPVPGNMMKAAKCKSIAEEVAYEHPFAFFITSSNDDLPRTAIVSVIFAGKDKN